MSSETARPRRERRARDEERIARRDGLDDAGSELFDALRALRLTLAKAEGVAAYMVFSDRTLIEMATARPVRRGRDARPSTASASEN